MRTQGEQTLAAAGVESVAPVSTTTVTSDKFLLADVVKFGIELIAVGTGIDIVVKLLISNDDTNYAIEDGYSNIINITDETLHRKTIHKDAIPAAKYGKLSFTGQNANPADAVMTGILNLIRDDR